MLTPDQNLTQAILVAIDTQPAIRLAILFGSLAAGRERADSDVDVAVDAGHRFTADEKLALMTELTAWTGRRWMWLSLRPSVNRFSVKFSDMERGCWAAGRAMPVSSVGTSLIRRIFCPIGAESSPRGDGHGSGSNRAEA